MLSSILDFLDADTVVAIATIFAVIYGPIKAVKIAHDLQVAQENYRTERDLRQEKERRKYSVLKDLMLTRKIRLSPQHVSALNAIELEFSDSDSVMAAFRRYVEHLTSPLPPPDQQERYFGERDSLFLDLLQSVGRSLDYQFDKHELSRLGYIPQGWADDEDAQRENIYLTRRILRGEAPLPIVQLIGSTSPFPPAPD